MHVAFLASEFLPSWGGMGTERIELARALRKEVELDVSTLERQVYGRPPMKVSQIEASRSMPARGVCEWKR